MKFLMVCLGNICRSPMAEGVMQKEIDAAGFNHLHAVDSCGFEAFHLGEKPHQMAIQTASNHGIDISKQRQRLFCVEDFDRFDKIFVMDDGNYNHVKRFARSGEDMQKVDYLYNRVVPNSNTIIPDPWGGTSDDFEHSFTMIEKACKEITKHW